MALACASGSASANFNEYAELNALAPLMIGPTYTAIFNHGAGESFADTLQFNVPAASLQGAVVNLSVAPGGTDFGFLTGDLYFGIEPSSKVGNPPDASCMPGCSNVGWSFVSNLGGNASSWTSSLVNLTNPGYYFVVIAGNTQIPGSQGGSYSASITLSTTPVPEASGWLMLMSGLGVVGMVSRRRLRNAA
jgi:hypothetical protein